MSLKLFFQNTLLICLGTAIGYYSVYGPQGIVAYCALKEQLALEKNNIHILAKNISHLKHVIARHHANQFELEAIARYDFGMGYTHEIIYVLPKVA